MHGAHLIPSVCRGERIHGPLCRVPLSQLGWARVADRVGLEVDHGRPPAVLAQEVHLAAHDRSAQRQRERRLGAHAHPLQLGAKR